MWSISKIRFSCEELSTYGWVYVIVGAILLYAAFSVYNRSQLARWIGIIGAALLTVSATWWPPFAPVWALVYVMIGIFVMYGLAVYDGRLDQPQ